MMLNRIKKYLSPSEPKAVVLMYHRVCNIKTDPWQIAVSPNNFEEHIKMITKSFKVLSLTDLEKQLVQGKIERNSIYVTFDDAYYDNFLYAKPILEKYNCPATFFVPSHFIDKQELFWWDELESIILYSRILPGKLTMNINDTIHHFEFEIENLTDEIQKKHESWNYQLEPPTNRCKLYLNISELLKPLPYEKIVAALNYIKKWSDFTSNTSVENLPMSSKHLKHLSNNKLFSLGIHTKTHPALANHSFEFQLDEIYGSKQYLSNINHSHINTIAYPHGNYNNETLIAARQNGVSLGFTTEEHVITRSSSPLTLGRLWVVNSDELVLKNNIVKML